MSITVVCKKAGYLLEGPHWDDTNNLLYFVDILGKAINKWDPVRDTIEKYDVPDQSIGAAVLTDRNNMLLALTRRIAFLDWRTKKLFDIQEVEDETNTKNRFNDGKCDPAGRFWAGKVCFNLSTNPSMDTQTSLVMLHRIIPVLFKLGVAASTMGPEEELGGVLREQGQLYCYHKDRSLTVHADKISISNGLAWSSCRKFMYYIDSMKYTVDVFDFDLESGQTSNRRVAIDMKSEGIPDGMCIDAEDMLWVAVFNGGKVIRYNPKTGEKLSELKFPTLNTTSCCWGGPNYDELYVTSAEHFLTEQQLKEQPTGGSVFRVTGLGVKGTKSDIYNE
ncbi:Regucalcin [Holothuria leucospilota]|uniref:Regucalcin n=1 Tax=Holothuria leucospilota TaxID=206669 RepID=A0A9Q1BUE6_HOLLE|nr:Regucalcin [Holothuria leucospilota]